MKLDQHGNGNGLDDLYILPETQKELHKIVCFLDSMRAIPEFADRSRTARIHYQFDVCDVQGNAWYGKRMIVIPFGEFLKKDLLDMKDLLEIP